MADPGRSAKEAVVEIVSGLPEDSTYDEILLAERGILFRAALLVRKEHRLILELFRAQLQKALPSVQSEVFTEPAEALVWLEK